MADRFHINWAYQEEEVALDGAYMWAKDYDALAAKLATADGYALLLVNSLARRFPAVTGWQPLPDLMGKLTQIDNMTCKLRDGFGEETRCPMYWGSHDKMCLLAVGHDGEHVFPAEASKIMTSSDWGEKHG
jgi:hypothetical protein